MKVSAVFTIGAMAFAGVAMAQDAPKKAPAGPGLTLTTTAFADGAEIPAGEFDGRSLYA